MPVFAVPALVGGDGGFEGGVGDRPRAPAAEGDCERARLGTLAVAPMEPGVALAAQLAAAARHTSVKWPPALLRASSCSRTRPWHSFVQYCCMCW